ncbi:hypothetical protein GOP47_0027496 [Adiantum capillus-veneris]|nr:hypothetical protein GOP47_0027496 [Adiantum capillus-veneris]
MGRAPCCDKLDEGFRKGAWTAEEDQKLVAFIDKNKGHGSWRTLPRLAGLQRCGKSCRLRWTNYLRPNIKRGQFSVEEEQTITQLHVLLGNKWSTIASHLPGRTDNEVKNHWNTHMKKRLTRMGIDPATHCPLNTTSHRFDQTAGILTFLQNKHSHASASLPGRHVLPDKSFFNHMAQWEVARLEAEARLAARSTSTSSSSSSARPTELIDRLKPSIGGVSGVPCLSWVGSDSSGSSLPSPESNKSVKLPTQAGMWTPSEHGRCRTEFSEMQISGGSKSKLVGSATSCTTADAESCTSEFRGSTSTSHNYLQVEEQQQLQQLMMMMSCGSPYIEEQELQAAAPLFDLLIGPASPNQPCESGPAYWAHLLNHGLVQVQASLSSCPC